MSGAYPRCYGFAGIGRFVRYACSMKSLGFALWRGMMSGASARDRASARQPHDLGIDGNIAQALYWLAFEVANVVVHGARA